MRLLERIARWVLLRRGAEWRKQTCGTCANKNGLHWKTYRYRDGDLRAEMVPNSAGCFLRHEVGIDERDRACPAWQRKEEQ